MAYTTIDDGSAHFQVATWTGDGSSPRTITNDGNSNLQPDLVWHKNRTDSGRSHYIHDSSRGFGAHNELVPNSDSIENSDSHRTDNHGYIASASTDSFVLGAGATNDNYTNNNTATYVAWQWKANGGTATATGSESGNNPAYSVQANQTAGFSIITYTGTGAEGDVTHGLGGKPDWIITKVRNGNADEPWPVWHKDLVDADADNGGYIYLNTTGEDQATSVFYEGDAISSTVVAFKGGNANVNADGTNYVMYCFRGIQGYSKFDTYRGNGNADGPFIYTGFKPVWVMIKETGATGSWHIFDNKRTTFNPCNKVLYADTNDTESTNNTGNPIDILSNGFKCRGSGNDTNLDDGRYIYMAFAEHPFVSSENVPVTAR